MKQLKLFLTLLALTMGWSNVGAQAVGDIITIDGTRYEITGENIVTNGSFDDGVNGWYSGAWNTASASNYTLQTEGGFDGGAYLQYSAGGVGSDNNIRNKWQVSNGQMYLFRCYTSGNTPSSNNLQYSKLWASADGSAETTTLYQLKWGADAGQTSDIWTENNFVFTATTDWVVFRSSWTSDAKLDGFFLVAIKKAVDDTAFQEALQDAKHALTDEANAIITGEERTALENAVNTYENASSEQYEEAIKALQESLETFTSAKPSYQKLADVIAMTTATGDLPYAKADKKPASDGITATSAADAVEKAAALTTALRAYVESNSIAEGIEGAKDFTTSIQNPNAENGNNGWTWTGSKNNPASNEPWTDADGNSTHTYFDGGSWGGNSWTTTMSQDLTLPPGKYLLAAKGRAAVNTTFTMSVGDVSADLPHVGNSGNVFDRGWNDAYLVFESDGLTASTIQVSASSSTIHEWFSVSQFRLTQIEAASLSDEVIQALVATIPTGKMNAEVKATMDAAKTTLEAEKTTEAYNALSAAITAANNSIAAYAHAKEELDKMVAELEGTNVYTAEAYKTHITDNLAAYEAVTLTDEAALAITMLAGWHAANTIDDVLISAWDAEPENWDGLHVNTWSADADFEETGFKVPLTEYWVGSGSLPAKTMTATVSGLEAGNYKVSANMFIHTTSLPAGISMQVGEAPAVTITGAQSGSFYVSEATAFGAVGDDGNLVIKLIVADGNNTNWIGFKNMKYEKVNIDYAALNTAIANANAMNATIANGVKALTDAIATAQEALQATTQDEVDAATEALTAATETAKTIIAARKNLAGVAKKAEALKTFLTEDISEAIAEATDYVANAEATVEEANSKAEALNANFAAWTTVELANATFDTGLNGALVEPATEEKPYIHAVDGWTPNFTFKSTASQGIAAAYGSAAQNGTNGTAAPATDMYGKSEGGTLHLSSGWSDQARYYQTIETLPAGKYVFYYEGFNANNTTNTLNSNYFGISELAAGSLEGTQNTFAFSEEKSFAYNEWKASAFTFTLTRSAENARINVGVVGGTASSNTTPKMWFDNVTIYRLVTTEMADAADYTALAEAIATAEGKTLGFDAGEYAPYENVAAIKALAAAKAINPEVENSKKVVEEATAALTAATWKANAEEVNAIYDGQFANTEANATSGDISLPGWTKVQGIRLLVKDEATDPGLAYTDGKAAVFAWGGTTVTYGEQTGYTLPLKQDALYELSFKISGWRDGDMPTYVTVSLDGAGQSKDITVKPINTADENPFASVKFYVKPTADNSLLTIYAAKHFTVADLMLVHATSIPGDVNGNMEVDVADVTALVNALQPEAEKPASADVDGDSDVDADDVKALVELILKNE